MPIQLPARLCFAVFRGDTFTQQFQFKRALSGTTAPVPVGLSGATIWATLKLTVVEPDNTAISQVTIGDGVTVDNASSGLFTVTFPPASTATLPDGVTTLELDIQIRESSGRVTTVLRGELLVEPDVTRTYAIA